MADIAGSLIMPMSNFRYDHMKCLIHGPQGSGKTTLASTIARAGKTLFVDIIGEHGVRSFAGAPYVKNIEIVRPSSITEMDDIFWALDAGTEYRAVVLDSLTAVQKMAGRYLMGHSETAVREIAKSGKAGQDTANWGVWSQSNSIMTDIATFWFGLASSTREHPMHVIITAQTKIKEDQLGDVSRFPDVQPGSLSTVLATPDYVFYTDFEDNPDAQGNDELPRRRHIVRIGDDADYRTKARIPYNLRGKIPPILGRKRPLDLVQLGQLLEIPGMPARRPAKAAPAKATSEEGTAA